MDMELRMCESGEYDEICVLLRRVFSGKNGYDTNFEQLFPRVFDREHAENMKSHIGAYVGGKLCGTAANYPLVYVVNGRELKIAASGNVAVDDFARGNGIMSGMMTELVSRLKPGGYAFSYLHGKQERYRRFGYELAGCQYKLSFDKPSETEVVEIKADMADEIVTAKTIYESQNNYIKRRSDEFYKALCSGVRKPYMIIINGVMAGYFNISASGNIGEFAAADAHELPLLFGAAVKLYGGAVNTVVPAVDEEALKILLEISASSQKCTPANFHISDFKATVETFLAAKLARRPKLEGSFTIDSDIFGKWKITAANGNASAETFMGDAEYKLTGYDVYSFMFDFEDEKRKGEAAELLPVELYAPYLT